MSLIEKEKLHSSVLLGPAKERRRDRKARRRAAAQLAVVDRKTKEAFARAEWEEERERQRSTTYLPPSGEPGSAALHTPGRFHLPRHQDTSATLAGAYPFMAEGGFGSHGVFVGADLYSGSSFVYDPWVLYSQKMITAPNVVLAGIVGSGKSSLAKSLYTRSIAFGRRVYVPGDPKGEHTAVAEAVGGKAIVLGHGLRNRLNPLDEGNRPAGLSARVAPDLPAGSHPRRVQPRSDRRQAPAVRRPRRHQRVGRDRAYPGRFRPVRRAIAGIRSDFSDLAQAYAASTLETIVALKYGPWQHYRKIENEYDQAQLFRSELHLAQLKAVFQKFDVDDIPTTFNRQATVHAVGRGKQYSRLNAVLAVGHLVSALC